MKINATNRLYAASKFFDKQYLTDIIKDAGYEEDDIDEQVDSILGIYKKLSGGKLGTVWDKFESLISSLRDVELIGKDISFTVSEVNSIIWNSIIHCNPQEEYLKPTANSFKDILVRLAEEVEDELRHNGYNINGELINTCKKAKADF